ncbi:hypothetical protein HPB47_022254 [Ixodes persulcatus]|uniref:Uncharacterized protein n=1 Tax=Ixodes persulcatus TaxID=34615 RepID=A0AC60QB90_IXOPE|nr:hypothetical protein HPB47_022254 [Ixodes persulcatus]
MLAGGMRIAGHVVYASKPHVARGSPRAALLVLRELPQSKVDLNDLCTEGAEFAPVTLELRRRPLTIVSAYVSPNAPRDTNVLVDIRVRAKGDLIVAGDFNAHSQSLGDKQDSPRRHEQQATLEAVDVRNITSGSQTFIRPGVTRGVIDLTFTTWSLRHIATPQRLKCTTLDRPSRGSRAWRMSRTLAGRPIPRNPLLEMTVAMNLRSTEMVKLLVDTVTAELEQAPSSHGTYDATTELQYVLDAFFTHHAAPGPDVVTSQAMKNVNESALPAMLDLIKQIWRTAELPDA